MKQYKQEVDALHASDTLRQTIERIPAQASGTSRRKIGGRRFSALAAVLAVVLAVGVIGVPSVFVATRRTGKAADSAMIEENYAAQRNSYGAAENASAEAFSYIDTKSTVSGGASVSNRLPANRKLIRDAELSVETKHYDAFLSSVNAQLSALGGYIQFTDSDTTYSGSRCCTLIFRVPADKLDAFLAHVSETGTVTSQSTSVQDVTDDYIDLESRVKALETEQETLLALLQKADSLTDTLEIQDRLSEVRASLESYKGKLKALEGQIDYSTVTIYLEEVERVSPPEGKTFMQQVRANLSENLYSIGQGFRSFGIAFLSNLPYIFLWLVLIGVVVLVVVLIVRRRKGK